MLTAKYTIKVPQGYVQLDRVAQGANVRGDVVETYEETVAFLQASPEVVAQYAEHALKRAADLDVAIDKDSLVYTTEQDAEGNCMVIMFGNQAKLPPNG